MAYFPRFTEPYQRRFSERDWENRGPAAFRKLAFSLFDMALVTAVVTRFGRAALLANAGEGSGLLFAAAFMLGALFLFTMTTLHLGNFPVRHWTWRAPAFALLEGFFEAVASLGLILLGREPYGSGRAVVDDWPSIALRIMSWRLVAITVFALLLAVVVQWARTASLRRQRL